MNLLLLIGLGHLAMTSGTTGLSFTDAARSSDPIVVTGQLPASPKEQAESYVRELGVPAGNHQAARWADPICPQAIGLRDEHAAIVERQIRRIISEVGAPLAREGCRGNLSVVFTDAPQKLVRHIAASGAHLPAASSRKLKNDVAPVRWWYNTEFRTRDGSPAVDLTSPAGFIEAEKVSPLPVGRSGNLSLFSSSMVSTQAIRAIRSATVIVDVHEADGVPLSAAVDYAALVGLAEVKLNASPRGSILSLFEADGQRRLTTRDRAFLQGLYRINMDRRAEQQRRAIIRAMVNAKPAS